MMNPQKQELLLDFARVFGHEQRVRLAAVLMDSACSTYDITNRFGWKTQTALEHIAALRSLGLVTATEDGRYHFDAKALYRLNHTLLSREDVPTPIDDWADENERKILRPFFSGQQIISLPTDPKKFSLLLRWLVTNFEVGVHYTEKQINEIITRHHEDYATLRREMINEMLMKRDHGIYWRIG